MSVFPALILEDNLQLNDKTRFDATKSYITNDESAITDVLVTPGVGETQVSVFDADSENWYLDYEYGSFAGDFDATNNKLDFNEGGSQLTATITPGTYASLTAIAAEVKTQLDSAGALTYTVTVDKDEKMTIAATGSFSLTPNEGTNRDTSILPILGFTTKVGFDDTKWSSVTTIKGAVIRYLPRKITLSVTNPSGTVTQDKFVKVYSVEGDSLFSDDGDLISKKGDILKWVRPGRNSFLDYHRQAQSDIMDHFRGDGRVDINSEPYEVKNFVHKGDLKEWSTYTALRLIFDDLSNDVEDIFDDEARRHEAKEQRLRNRIVRVDIDNDGKSDIGEVMNLSHVQIHRV